MVRTLTLLVAALVATCVSAAPLDAHQKVFLHQTDPPHNADFIHRERLLLPPPRMQRRPLLPLFSAIAANPTGGTAVDAAISAAATAASAAAKANQEALIAANGGDTSFLDPRFRGQGGIPPN
ncbi:hypothetical protein B0H14DRAFT_2616171 [Mycena olivaceomarginata]|nr:hypothetical protein B0H14DRAFT_2616171 [Mycena olivaceomarginata]